MGEGIILVTRGYGFMGGGVPPTFDTLKIGNLILIPQLVPLNEFSKNSNLPLMMYSIVLYNHVKNEKIVRAILEKSKKNTHDFSTLYPL